MFVVSMSVVSLVPRPGSKSRRKGLVSAVYVCAYSPWNSTYGDRILLTYFRTLVTPILILHVTLSVDSIAAYVGLKTHLIVLIQRSN